MLQEIDIVSTATVEMAVHRLSTLIEHAGAGHWGLLWIDGEPQSGKSTLLRHFGSHAEERGCVVLSGEGPVREGACLEWTRILRSARPAVPFDTVVEDLLPEHGPALRRLLPRFDDNTDLEHRKTGDPNPEIDDRVVRAMSGLLDRLAQRIPVVALLDNFDFATETLLTRFESILDGLAHASVVVVVTTTSRNLALEGFRSRLRTRRRLATITLKRRPLEDTAEGLLQHAEDVLTSPRDRALGPWEADLRVLLARIYLERGDVPAAKTQARTAKALARSGRPSALAMSRSILSRIALFEGKTEAAKRQARASLRGLGDLALCDKVGILITHAHVFHRLAQGSRDGDRDRDAAAEAVGSLLDLVRDEGHTELRAKVLRELETLGIPITSESPREGRIPCAALASYAPEARIRIRVFGPLQVSTGTNDVIQPADWKSNKARHIFSFLLFQRQSSRGVPKERILDAVWPEVPWDAVENTFHATLTIVRRVLARRAGSHWGAVVHGGGCYRLVLDGEPWLDCEAFGRAFANGQRAEGTQNPFRALECYREAATLYEGDFLEDVHLDWTDPYRERFRQDYQTALFRLGRLTLNAWRPADALHWAQKLLATDALDERAHRLSMYAHVALGHRKPALEEYERYRSRLHEELGVAPEPETLEAVRCIQAGTSLPPLD